MSFFSRLYHRIGSLDLSPITASDSFLISTKSEFIQEKINCAAASFLKMRGLLGIIKEEKLTIGKSLGKVIDNRTFHDKKTVVDQKYKEKIVKCGIFVNS